MPVGRGYQVVMSRPAVKSFEGMTQPVQLRIAPVIEALRIDPRPRGVEKLSGRKDQYRIRVGDYRIVYSIEDKLLVILVLQIGNRREIYRKGRK